MNSRFNGVVSGNNIEQVFVNLQAPPLLKSQASRVVIDWQWQGSPAAFAVNPRHGTIGINMKQGVFFQNKSSASTGVLRLLGLFNFNTWARRLKFDFSDVYKKGVTFDQVTGELLFNKGLIYFKNPLVVKSPSSEFTMAGVISYPEENLDAVLVTTLPVSGNLTVAAALAAGLPAAVGVYIVSKIFKPQVDKVSSLTYSVKGNWNDPKVEFVNVFNKDLNVQESAPSSGVADKLPAVDTELNDLP
jgi:uncharacterized protein YhdP